MGSRVLDRDETLTALKPILEDPAVEKVGQNLKYDMHVLANHGVTRADAEQMVLAARLKAGWITEDELAAEEESADEAVGA